MATDNFHLFARMFRKQFDTMAKGQLYTLDTRRNEIWELYLAAFPEGTNPVFKTNTEHDCSCCRHFIRDIGNVVSIKDGALVSVWDLTGLPEPYQAVADKVAADIRLLSIRSMFVVPFTHYGQERTLALINGATHAFKHFSVNIPPSFVNRDYVAQRGRVRTTFDVLKRGLAELTVNAVATVIDLIQSNALYRGAEHLEAVRKFAELQAKVRGINDPVARDLAIWAMVASPVARFRNTVIGTLVQDLSDGKSVEEAVRLFEAKVAPQNYKRPTAVISKGMVEKAMATIAELGLEEALERRHARLSDVSVESVLFVDNAVQGEMKGGLKGLLMEEVKPAPFDPKKAEEITIDAFIAEVLPRATGMKVFLENGHLGNFMSLTAPVHADSGRLFKWSNDFAWSYEGNVTDSIKEKVKRAGGRVENVALRVSLAWSNRDDLDLHAIEPGGNHIHFRNKDNKLDVDMNVRGETRSPVENIRWVQRPRDGIYDIYVNQFTKRESIDVGFEIEIESAGVVTNLSYPKAVPAGTNKAVAKLVVRGGQVTIEPAVGMLGGAATRESWGLKTQELIRVNSLVLSPNYWGENKVGNKHWFFILDGCNNPLPTRGIYNEFLSGKLEEHRKVFEVLGDKTKCPPTDDQLSGVGFSSTRQDKVAVAVTGPKLNKAYAIVFGG